MIHFMKLSLGAYVKIFEWAVLFLSYNHPYLKVENDNNIQENARRARYLFALQRVKRGVRLNKEISFISEGRTPSPNSMERHKNVELASAKAEVRKLRNIL